MMNKWKVYEQGDADEFCLIMDDNRWVIAFRLDGGLYRGQQKRVINMIAAAPEMLAALKQAEQQIDYGQIDAAHRIIIAAIAKAESPND